MSVRRGDALISAVHRPTQPRGEDAAQIRDGFPTSQQTGQRDGRSWEVRGKGLAR